MTAALAAASEPRAGPPPEVLLRARGLSLTLPDRGRRTVFGRAPAVEIFKHVDLDLRAGESLALVGESGSGKTSLGRTLIRLLDPSDGSLYFDGVDITRLRGPRLRALRAAMQIVFQDPQSALNPRQRIGTILTQPLRAFGRLRDRRRQAAELLQRVGLPAEFARRYPHQLSGGQRQRVGIARAIALKPKLLIADEIVSGLDVSTQAQILDLLAALKRDLGLALVFISHDLSVVRLLCERTVVLRGGEIVETAPTAELFARPQDAYTCELLAAIPLPDVDPDWLDRDDALVKVTTTAPETVSMPSTPQPASPIHGRVALVTGANRGIGSAFVDALLERGAARVYAAARDEQDPALQAKAADPRVVPVRLDTTNFEHIAAAVGRCHDVDLLINNAGVNRVQGLIAAADLAAARDEMDVNYFGTLAMCRAFAPLLGRNGGGAIVNVLSVLARVNLPLMGSLSASKAAAYSLTQGVRAELAAQDTAVIAVLPGAVDTAMSRDFPPPKLPPREVADEALAAVESGRSEVYPGDMARGIARALADDAAAVAADLGRMLPAGSAGAAARPEPEFSGGCVCGAVRFAVRGAARRVEDCRCGNCRRISGADAVRWATFDRTRFSITDGELASFATSQKGRRGFCAHCGTTLTYSLDVFPDDIDVTVSSFDDADALTG